MDKLEEHIKRKLQGRELQPSETAWSKIESQLGDDTTKHVNKRVYWYAIAASFIGVLFLSVAYFNSGSELQPVLEVVDVKTDSIETNIDEEMPNQKTKILITKDEVAVENEIKPIEKLTPILKLKEPVQQDFVLLDNKEEEVVMQEEIAINEQKLIDNKLNDVLNVVADLEQQNIEITDFEIDSLLLVAQRELLANKVFQENGKVDAMALLAEAEDELDRTFRGQLFEKLKDGFFKVRTAVADRNN
ncbi:hypothetical protein [Croceitalea rosinachiae]|uniref:Uncharacterized protein n=1 Tax=Croceitalea rosinachiae TaxID=3075596 RepID=A0ABU3A6J1_9FLAO|nr:hypothetical protein [Croceitalea sp. F388]MDT0605520.1 hypothetical protein [Croceitalea sp. F388]